MILIFKHLPLCVAAAVDVIEPILPYIKVVGFISIEIRVHTTVGWDAEMPPRHLQWI
jgi:hypothetical protein